MISATIVADSKNTFGQRITTMKLVFPRIVLAEFNTHRMLTRNSASSRAIPFKKMVKMVQENPFIPIGFQKDHKGMQGTVYLEGEELEQAKAVWLHGRNMAVNSAMGLHAIKVTKQLANRLLEPFMYHTVLVTATEWDNFFALRAHPDAEIHIAKLAECMLEAYNNSTPKQLKPGEWHIPFLTKEDMSSIAQFCVDNDIQDFAETRKRIAIARCARLSYETLGDNPKIDYAADLRLFDQLLSAGHMSPFEHVARAMTADEYESFAFTSPQEISPDGSVKADQMDTGWCGNFRGFIQYRKMIPGENKSDSRVLKK